MHLGDVMGLGMAWGASVLAQRRPTPRYTYGLRRSTILAALANAILLLVAVGGITWEAIRRFGEHEKVARERECSPPRKQLEGWSVVSAHGN